MNMESFGGENVRIILLLSWVSEEGIVHNGRVDPYFR